MSDDLASLTIETLRALADELRIGRAPAVCPAGAWAWWCADYPEDGAMGAGEDERACLLQALGSFHERDLAEARAGIA